MLFTALPALLVALLPLVRAQDNDTAAVLQDLINAKIIPDVVPSFTPQYPLDVVYTDSTGSRFPVTAGSSLTANQTAIVPSFALKSTSPAIAGQSFLLAIVDPDAPNPTDPTLAQFRHFLVSDYGSTSATNGQFVLTNRTANGTLTEYTPPAPPESSVAHRYAVLCYLQSAPNLTPPDGFHPVDRLHFNITDFVSKVPNETLTLVAATFFYVSFNDTTGNIAPNSTTGNPPAQAAASSTSKPSGAIKLGTATAWSVVAVLSATGALLL